MAIHIGTSGFSYEDWREHFYPAKLAQSAMLEFYARVFQTVEINSTFYRTPTPTMMERIAKKVPGDFVFTVKLPQDITHRGDPPPTAFAEFRRGVAPVRERGMLGCILAQYPWSFRPSSLAEDRLRRLAAEFTELQVVVEFRNHHWARDETYELLRSLGLGFCCVDEPQLEGLMPPQSVATSGIGYVRFHGRNAAKWWRHEHAYERYDYLYSEAELREWLPRIGELIDATQELYLFFNNHYEGQAAQNARQLAQLLGLASPPLPTEPQTSLPF